MDSFCQQGVEEVSFSPISASKKLILVLTYPVVEGSQETFPIWIGSILMMMMMMLTIIIIIVMAIWWQFWKKASQMTKIRRITRLLDAACMKNKLS